MPTSFNFRRACIAAAASAAFGASAAPAAAQELPVDLPCVPGVNCPDSAEPKPEPAPRAKSKCRNANLQPARGNLRKVRRATLCLLNDQRRKHGLGKLRANRPLRVVATRYARDMVRRSFFDHVSPTGSTFVERIKQSAYLDTARGYKVGENLAWAAGPLATPRRIVRSWMQSPGHRANVLTASFRDIGVGVALGVPVRGVGTGATYVNEFGKRS